MKAILLFFAAAIYILVTNPNQLLAQDAEFKTKIGQWRLALISEAQTDGQTSILINPAPKIIKEYAPGNKFPSAVNAFLLTDGQKAWLVDTGFGRNVLTVLKSEGLTPAQINGVLLTHLHRDHIGGLVKGGQKIFPEAKIYISEAEYEYWSDPTKSSQESFKSAQEMLNIYKDSLVLFTPGEIGFQNQELVPGLSALAAYGHTPGHTAFLWQPQDEKLLIWGDLTHALAVQMPQPTIAVTYDVNSEEAVVTRLEFLEWAAKNNLKVAGMHIPFPGLGHLKSKVEGGYEFTPLK